MWFLKGEKEKKRKKFCGMGEQWPLKSSRSHFTSRGGVLVEMGRCKNNGFASFSFVCTQISSVIRSRNRWQRRASQYLNTSQYRVLSAHWLPQLCASCSLCMCVNTRSCLPTMWLREENGLLLLWLWDKIDQNQCNLPAWVFPGSCKPSTDSRLPN